MTNQNLDLSPLPEDIINPPEQVIETPPSQEPETIVPTDDGFIRISRENLAADLRKLQREDERFREVFNQQVGAKAARDYRPRINELERQLTERDLLVRQQQYLALTPEQVNQRFQTDPVFAQDYARTVHFQPQGNVVDPAQELLTFVLNDGVERGLTEQQYTDITREIASGRFDTPEGWRAGINLVKSYIDKLVLPLPTPVTPQIQPTPPVRRDAASPDMSAGRTATGGRQTYTITEIRAMPIEEQIRLFPNMGDMERAVEAGWVKVPGLN